jgi:hypothetical protein
LIDSSFFNEFLKIPGGLTDCLSAFFMQFWFSDLSISIFLIFCVWAIAILTRKWMETLTENRLIHTVHLIPAVLLVFLHGQYDFHLSITIALIINLSFLNLIIRWASKHQLFQTIFCLFASVLLFWITGGAFLIYVVLCGFNELILKKHITRGFIILIISVVLPYAASASVFLITLKQSYLHNLISENLIRFWYIGYLIPAFYVVVLLLASLAKISKIPKPLKKIVKFTELKELTFNWQCLIGTPILLCVATFLIQKTDDHNIRLGLEINQSVKEGRWQDVLKTAKQSTTVNPLLSCQTNVALYESNMLLDRIFAFPQFYGTSGLLMDYNWCSYWPEEASNVYWKLGLVNESLHWAHEAFEKKGPTPDILQRLGTIYMVKGDTEAAKPFFMNLKNVPFQEKNADDLMELDENSFKLAQDSAISYIRSCLPTGDLISLDKSIPEKLELLLKRNPKNKMAFEYLIAFHLMDGNLKGFLDHFADGKVFNYSGIPRHMQEALLVITSMSPTFDQNQLKNMIQPITYRRFMAYQQILHNHQENRFSARPELQKLFGDTYWYYLMYVRPEARKEEHQNEYQ